MAIAVPGTKSAGFYVTSATSRTTPTLAKVGLNNESQLQVLSWFLALGADFKLPLVVAEA